MREIGENKQQWGIFYHPKSAMMWEPTKIGRKPGLKGMETGGGGRV